MENQDILFEQEVCEYLRIPSIPKKEWDRKTPFESGVVAVHTISGQMMFGVAKSDGNTLRIVKVFTQEPFDDAKIALVRPLPAYMETTSVDDMDLDEESKKRAKELAKEAKDIENQDVQEASEYDNLSEWVFPEIENKEQAIAWLTAYRKRNKIKGKTPTSEETLKNCLLAIYAEEKSKK